MDTTTTDTRNPNTKLITIEVEESAKGVQYINIDLKKFELIEQTVYSMKFKIKQ